MTCPICAYQWCWLCGGTYTKYHYMKYNILGCPGQNYSYKRRNILTIYLIRFLWLIFLIILYPFAVILWFPLFITYYINDNMFPYCWKKWHRIIIAIISFCFGIVVDIIIVPLTIIATPIIVIYVITKEF